MKSEEVGPACARSFGAARKRKGAPDPRRGACPDSGCRDFAASAFATASARLRRLTMATRLRSELPPDAKASTFAKATADESAGRVGAARRRGKKAALRKRTQKSAKRSAVSAFPVFCALLCFFAAIVLWPIRASSDRSFRPLSAFAARQSAASARRRLNAGGDAASAFAPSFGVTRRDVPT